MCVCVCAVAMLKLCCVLFVCFFLCVVRIWCGVCVVCVYVLVNTCVLMGGYAYAWVLGWCVGIHCVVSCSGVLYGGV